jgi:hypothetical protein
MVNVTIGPLDTTAVESVPFQQFARLPIFATIDAVAPGTLHASFAQLVISALIVPICLLAVVS